jgi:hypothetical protein
VTDLAISLTCQRCGTAMDLRDPAPGAPWVPQQFWVCPRCGRHFWTTYASATPAVKKDETPAAAPAKPAATEAPAKPAAADAPAKPVPAAAPAKPAAPATEAPTVAPEAPAS